MDLDRITLTEARQMSKIIDLLGTPETPDELQSVIDVLDATTTLYRKTLAKVREQNARHGD